MEIKVGEMYKLVAHWHTKHGELVEIIDEREGITEAYAGQTIYHVAFDPLEKERRKEDLDTEFIDLNFKECILEDDVNIYRILDHFMESLPKDLIDAAHQIKEEEGVDTYIYIYDGQLHVTYGRNEEEARKDAFMYMMDHVKLLEELESDEH